MKQPVLAIRCKTCGNVYFGHALMYRIDEYVQTEIQNAANRGDDFLTMEAEQFKYEGCDCDFLIKVASALNCTLDFDDI